MIRCFGDFHYCRAISAPMVAVLPTLFMPHLAQGLWMRVFPNMKRMRRFAMEAQLESSPEVKEMSASSDRCDAIVGIRLLNVDHREIEGLIDELHALLAGSDKGRIINILRKLSGFVRTHFALEEGMMSATEYPNLAAHRHHHQSLLIQLDSFISLYLKGRLALTPGALSFLFAWYSAHSRNDDAQYADWLVIRDSCLSQTEPAVLPPGARSTPA